jgi:DNA-binding XRE family transcriptional regulator
MTPIEKIRDDLVGRFPHLRITVDPPALETGSWDLDVVREGELDPVNVEWRPGRGFGVTTPGPDDYTTQVDEVYGGAEATFRRVVQLVESGGSTVPPETVRLAELRQGRGLSQAEVAERAGVKQANISRIEGRDDLKVSTLARVVAAMGGTLSIRAMFPDGTERELDFGGGWGLALPDRPARRHNEGL